MSGRTWTDVFDEVPIEDLTDRRHRLARLVETTTFDRTDVDRIVGDLWDPTIVWTENELQILERDARISQRRPSDEYAPSQKALARWIREFCDLSI